MRTEHNYRPDVDGLRAIAVLSVLAYHYGVSSLPGGFSGVDVFFVISGFLITGILRREIENGQFSLIGFYDRRIRRILPALATVLAFSLVVGWGLLLPGDYAALGRSAAYSAAGLGNLYFFRNTGYFDPAAETQPLLHTWSLGVEEQFYVVWPLALFVALFLTRDRAKLIGLWTLVVGIGFGYAVYLTSQRPAAAFYLPHPRAWELLLGASISFLPPLRHRLLSHIAGLIGITLIIYSFVALTQDDLFPGVNAAYACLGAALLILPKAPDIVSRALSLRPVVGVGLISYSLYLWHWPVLVFYRHYNLGKMPAAGAAVALALLSLVLAYLSWRFIERPFRKPLGRPSIVVARGVAVAAGIAGIGFALNISDGVPSRLRAEVQAMSSLNVMWEWDCKKYKAHPLGNDACFAGHDWATASTKVLVWGDSHAGHIGPVVEAAYKGTGTAILVYQACPPNLGGTVHRYRPELPAYHDVCVNSRKRVLEFLKSNPDISRVIFSAAWTSKLPVLYRGNPTEQRSVEIGQHLMATSLEETIREASSPNRSILLIGQIPNWGLADPVQCAVARYPGLWRAPCEPVLDSAPFWKRHTPTHSALKEAAAKFDNVEVLIPGESMCNEHTCITSLEGEFLYRDRSHLRRNLNEKTLISLARKIGIAHAASIAAK